jgi:hypothetical protein
MADRLDDDFALREATITVRYEDLCERPAAVMSGTLSHAGLPNEDLCEAAASRVRAPAYYQPRFTPDEDAAIVEETAAVAERYGYEADDAQNSVGSEHAAV